MPFLTGTLQYDPRIATDEGEIFDPWWLIFRYDPALLDRLRARAERINGVRLSYPRWGAHISIVSGEVPRRKSRWGYRDGETMRLEYDLDPMTDGIFTWHKVRGEELFEIRSYLGLPRTPRGGLHLTLGRLKK